MHSTRVTIASALARRRVRRRACVKRKAIRELVCKYYLCEEQEEEKGQKGGHQDSKRKSQKHVQRHTLQYENMYPTKNPPNITTELIVSQN